MAISVAATLVGNPLSPLNESRCSHRESECLRLGNSGSFGRWYNGYALTPIALAEFSELGVL